MGSLYAKDMVDLAFSEIGYVGGKGTSKYTAELDSVNYWQMSPKNGSPDADWCSIFYNWLAYRSTRNSDGDTDPDKWDAHYFLFEPDKGENLAAGCGYAADYYMKNDSWYGDCQDAERGDQVFFRNYNHTGIVVDWDSDGIYTVEGNTSANGVKYCVAKKFYRFGDSSIDGFGRPRFDGWEYPTKPKETAKPKEDPKPKEPVKPSKPKEDPFATIGKGNYIVSKTPARLQTAPNVFSAILTLIPNKSVLFADKVVNGFIHTSYGGYTGYVSLKYIKSKK